jgi:two-component system sensor histidine kinase TctE
VAGLALAFATAGALVAHNVVEQTADRLLAGSVRAIAETVTARDGEIRVELAPWSLGLLDSPERDIVYYAVRHDGRLLTGYEDVPTPRTGQIDGPNFSYVDIRHVRMRLAAQTVRVPGFEHPVTVLVAQSLDSRRAVFRQLMVNLIGLPLVIIVVGGLLLWPAMRWGLAPLRRISRTLIGRASASEADFSPAPAHEAPVELRGIVEAFNRLLEHLERSTAGVRKFTADASHQLRTPLAVITAHMQIVRDGRRDWREGERSLINDAILASDRMAALLSQLLTVARADAVTADARTDLSDAARKTMDEISDPEFHVRLRLPRTAAIVPGEALLLQEMIFNIVDNALRYGGDGAVTVWIRHQADAVALVIWDQGPGVAEEDLPHLFVRFYRGRQAAARNGSGLGLAIVEALAHAYGATATAHNRRRRSGLVVKVKFPLA